MWETIVPWLNLALYLALPCSIIGILVVCSLVPPVPVRCRYNWRTKTTWIEEIKPRN